MALQQRHNMLHSMTVKVFVLENMEKVLRFSNREKSALHSLRITANITFVTA